MLLEVIINSMMNNKVLLKQPIIWGRGNKFSGIKMLLSYINTLLRPESCVGSTLNKSDCKTHETCL